MRALAIGENPCGNSLTVRMYGSDPDRTCQEDVSRLSERNESIRVAQQCESCLVGLTLMGPASHQFSDCWRLVLSCLLSFFVAVTFGYENALIV
jgi:hypothetical protein